MLERINDIPRRIEDLKRKLAAREGKSEFKENVKAIKSEIERLEGLTQQPGGALASGDDPGTQRNVT